MTRAISNENFFITEEKETKEEVEEKDEKEEVGERDQKEDKDIITNQTLNTEKCENVDVPKGLKLK